MPDINNLILIYYIKLWFEEVKRAQFLSVKEPLGLSRSDCKSSGGATLILWMRGRPLAWDITIADMYANLYIGDSNSNKSCNSCWLSSFRQDGQVYWAGQDPPHQSSRSETDGFCNCHRVREKDHGPKKNQERPSTSSKECLYLWKEETQLHFRTLSQQRVIFLTMAC